MILNLKLKKILIFLKQKILSPPTNNSKEPSKDPPINAAEKSEKDKKLAKLFLDAYCFRSYCRYCNYFYF